MQTRVAATVSASCQRNLWAEKEMITGWIFAGMSVGKRQWTVFRLCTDNYWIYKPYQTVFMYMKSLEKTLNIGATITSTVTGIKSWFEHMFSVFSFHVLHPPSCKHKACPAFKVLWKISDKILFQVFYKKWWPLNENLRRETIFLATTLAHFETSWCTSITCNYYNSVTVH